jgi:hypothetical protein
MKAYYENVGLLSRTLFASIPFSFSASSHSFAFSAILTGFVLRLMIPDDFQS